MRSKRAWFFRPPERLMARQARLHGSEPGVLKGERAKAGSKRAWFFRLPK